MTGERWNEGMLDSLATSVSELREGQALLVQIVSEDKQSAGEFRRATNSVLDRLELVVNRLAEGQERQGTLLESGQTILESNQVLAEQHQVMLERHQLMLERHQLMLERLESLARSLAAGQERQERLLEYLMQRDRDRG